ncbi:hypothetical protein BDR06DRAFT_1014436 [Suillus hirtellus]|nr:hypothetical protein BDR06DRAFT_1014436 [Suillus hirtellus]
MTVEGYIAAQVMEGLYDAEQFYDFVVEEVLPHMSPFSAEQSILALNNCHIHHNEVLIELIESAGYILYHFLVTLLTSP